jgi:hypothetical protein
MNTNKSIFLFIYILFINTNIFSQIYELNDNEKHCFDSLQILYKKEINSILPIFQIPEQLCNNILNHNYIDTNNVDTSFAFDAGRIISHIYKIKSQMYLKYEEGCINLTVYCMNSMNSNFITALISNGFIGNINKNGYGEFNKGTINIYYTKLLLMPSDKYLYHKFKELPSSWSISIIQDCIESVNKNKKHSNF